MTKGHRRFRWILLVVALALIAAACGGDSEDTTTTADVTDTTAGGADTTDAGTPADLNSLLPDDVREAGKVTVATGASWPPDQYMEDDGTIVGWSVDILTELGSRLGIEMDISNLDFPGILPGIEAGRFDVGSSSFSLTDERLAAVDCVTYYQNGQILVVAAGNPDGIDPDDICGLRWGSTQGSLAFITGEALSEECVAAGKEPLDLLEFLNGSEVLLAIDSGRADLTSITLTQLGTIPEVIETIGDPFSSRTVGFIFEQGRADLEAAFQAGLQEMMDDGTYLAILEEWGIERGAITASEVLTEADI